MLDRYKNNIETERKAAEAELEASREELKLAEKEYEEAKTQADYLLKNFKETKRQMEDDFQKELEEFRQDAKIKISEAQKRARANLMRKKSEEILDATIKKLEDESKNGNLKNISFINAMTKTVQDKIK
jgi:hypothetical protein